MALVDRTSLVFSPRALQFHFDEREKNGNELTSSPRISRWIPLDGDAGEGRPERGIERLECSPRSPVADKCRRVQTGMDTVDERGYRVIS